jgi:hypothetical protein
MRLQSLAYATKIPGAKLTIVSSAMILDKRVDINMKSKKRSNH